VGVGRDSRKLPGHPYNYIYRPHRSRGHLCDSTAFLFYLTRMRMGLETSSWSSSLSLDRSTPQRQWICSCQPLETGHSTGPWWSDASREGPSWLRDDDDVCVYDFWSGDACTHFTTYQESKNYWKINIDDIFYCHCSVFIHKFRYSDTIQRTSIPVSGCILHWHEYTFEWLVFSQATS